MSGVDNMQYMVSTNANNGGMNMRVTFDIKTQPNINLILTQMRQALGVHATARRRQQLWRGREEGPELAPADALAVLAKGTRDRNFLANYAYINMVDELARAPGVGDVLVYGGAMPCRSG